MTILQYLESRLREAVSECGFAGDDLSRVSVTQAADLRFGDYQSNVAMVLAKSAKRNPRELAGEIRERIVAGDVAEIEIAGPGFLNFRVAPAAFADRAGDLLEDDRLGVPLVEKPSTVVVDFSAPNIAKPMHVGHIRSTIIGDALSRLGRFLGHRVITDNHVGDWGTQFGMVIWAWNRPEGGVDREALDSDPLSELLRLYRLANNASKEDEAVREECRRELVKLQQGDPGNLEIWEECVRLSRNGLQRIYSRLNVRFDHWLGESCYNDRLEGVVEDLLASGLARESEGAVCVFSDGTEAEEKDPFRICRDGAWQDNPMIVRKRDGGFNYSTSDIATIDYRLEEFGAEAIWYVVDHRQSLHFRQLFALAGRRGLSADFAHVSFGTILGKDGKPLKTRSGDLPQLEDLLDDAVSEARKSAEERSRLETGEEKDALAELIGISAVKFTELSHHRTSDYIFDLEKMVAMEGDTAPYLQYSYVRCRSIFRKLDAEVDLDRKDLVLEAAEEIHLARMLARYGETVPAVLEGLRPNLLANYLLELARSYHSFFQACPVLKAEGASRKTRLVLCELTARVLQQGLGLLGIEVPERM